MKHTMSRRDFLKVTTGAIGVGLLASCAPAQPAPPPAEPAAPAEEAQAPEATTAPEPTPAEEAAPEPTQAPAVDEGSKTGVMWGLQYDPHVEAYNRLAKLFNEKTGMTVKVEPQGWPVDGKLMAALAAGTGPDVMCQHPGVAQKLYIQDALLTTEEVVFKHLGVDPQKAFFEDAIGVFTWRGHIMGVPVESNGVGMVVNVPADEVEKLGLQDKYPPGNNQPFFDSFEHMWELAKALQVKEGDRVAKWGLSSKGWEVITYLAVLRTLLAPEGMDWWDPVNKKFNFDNEAGVEAVRLHAETPVKMGIETELDQTSVDAALAGKVALARGNGTPAVEGRKLGYQYRLAGVPMLKPGEKPILVGDGGWGFMAPREAKNQNISLEYLRMMATTEGQREYCKIYGGYLAPGWRALTGKYDHFADPNPEGDTVRAAKLFQEQLLPQVRFVGSEAGYGVTDMEAVMSEVRQLKLSPEEAVKQFQNTAEVNYKQWEEDLKAMEG